MIADTQPQAEYVPAETTARPTPAPIIPDYDYNEQPIVPEVTEEPVGYNYPVPDVTLPIRPVTTTQVGAITRRRMHSFADPTKTLGGENLSSCLVQPFHIRTKALGVKQYCGVLSK